MTTTTMFTVSVFNGREHPAVHPYAVERHANERDARRAAARMLGHSSLRGASSWSRYQGGTVYQFGPRTEDTEYDFAVVQRDGDEG